MIRALSAAAAAGLALASCATTRTEDDADGYQCVLERAEAGGTLILSVGVEQDGRRTHHHFSWVSRTGRDNAQVRLEWNHILPMTPQDEMTVTFTFRRSWRPRFVRIVLSRDEGSADGWRSRTITGPTYGRDNRSASVTMPFGELRDFLAGAPSLTASVVAANGNRLRQDRIEAGVFDAAAQAIAAAQPQIEAMVADYRHRCAIAPPERILVT